MSYTFYKFIHFVGIFVMLLSLGAVFSHSFQGGTKANFKGRKFFGALHGIGLLISFVAGFGLMARAGFSFNSGWLYVKLAVWFCLGGFPVFFYKKPSSLLPIFVLFGLLAALLYSVIYKPF